MGVLSPELLETTVELEERAELEEVVELEERTEELLELAELEERAAELLEGEVADGQVPVAFSLCTALSKLV